MGRLPSYRQLQAMSAFDAWQVLQSLAESMRDERDGLLEGHIRVCGRMSRRAALESVRRRLQRVYRAANDLGVHVGQPDPGEPKESTRWLDWMTPLGKALGDCTGHEADALALFFNTVAENKDAIDTAYRKLRATTQPTA